MTRSASRLLLALASLAWSLAASAADVEPARLIRETPQARQIKNLTFKGDELRVEVRPKPDSKNPKEKQFTAILEGRYQRDQWNLLEGVKPVPTTGSEGDFRIEMPLDEEDHGFELLAVSPLGEIEKEKFRVVFPGYGAYLKELHGAEPETQKLIGFNVGLGFSAIRYTDTRPGLNLTELGITPKVAYSHTLGLPWLEAGGSIFGTAVTFANSQAVDAHYFGLNARIGYVFAKIEPWRISLNLGYYFTTMFVNPAVLGFQNMQGPQILPAFRYLLKTGSVLTWYAKYSLVTGGGFLSWSSFEAALGFGYGHKMKYGYLGPTFDIAYLALPNIMNPSTGVSATVATLSATLGVSYAF